MRSGPPVGQFRPTPEVVNGAHAHTTVQLLEGKWAPAVLIALATRRRRLAGLANAVGGASNKVLTQTLCRMRRNRLVVKRVVDDDGHKTTVYALTARGRSLLPVVVELAQWAHADAARAATRPAHRGPANR